MEGFLSLLGTLTRLGGFLAPSLFVPLRLFSIQAFRGLVGDIVMF